MHPPVGRVLPYIPIGGISATIYTHQWDGCCHMHPPVGEVRVLPYAPTGGTGVADGTRAATAPRAVTVLGVRHGSRGAEALVDDCVTVVSYLADHRVPTLKIEAEN